MSGGLRLYLFGGFRLERTEGEVLSISLRKAEALLAYLAMAAVNTASRETLATLLWGEFDQARARQSLRQALFALTREFARAEVTTLRMESRMVSLAPDSIWVDACEFENLADKGGMDGLTAAAAYYGGGFLQGFSVDSPDFDDWLITTRTRMDELALKSFINLLDLQEAAGEISAGIETAQMALRVDRCREDFHRCLMRLFMAGGMRSSALHQYRQCRDLLERELGVPPDEETNALHKSILEQGPCVAPGPGGAHEEPQSRLEMRPGRGAFTNSPSVSVGRVRELHALSQHLEKARKGHCRLVAVVGEAGVGKSHLLDGFAMNLASQGAVGLATRGRRTEQSLALGLWADLLNHAALAEYGGLDGELGARDWLVLLRPDRLSTADGVEGTGLDRRHLYQAVVARVRARAARRPIALIFDDLQWADEESLRLISFAVRHLADAPVLFVAAIPSEELGRGLLSDLLNDLERDDLLSLITLQPLSRAETAELIQQFEQQPAGESEPKLRTTEIWELSEGNPRIIAEAWAANAEHSGTARSHKPNLPVRVLTDVSHALAPFGETTRALANAASVVGPRIDFDILRRTASLDQEDAVRGVEELVAARILTADGDELVFARKRVGLAVYESLLPQRRRALHAAAARAIEDIHADGLERHFAALAHHYRAAGDTVKGLECELACGVADLKRGARGSARRHFQRTLKSAHGLARHDRVRVLRLDARLALGAIAESEQNLDAASAIYGDLYSSFDRIENPRQRIAMLNGLSRISYMRNDEEGAYDFARRALTEAGRVDGDSVWPPADGLLVRLHLIDGALGRTIDRLIKARGRAHGVQSHEDEADAAAALGVLYAVQGEFTAAAAQCRRAVQLAEGLGNERSLAAALQFRGMAAMWQGAFEAALDDFDKAGAIAEDRGDVLRLYTLAGHRGFALARAERYDEAMIAFKTALDMAVRLDTKVLRPLFMAWMAEAAIEAGRVEDALHSGRGACRMAADNNQPWARSIALRALARVLAHPEVGDLKGADKLIRLALADQKGLGIKFETARSMVVRAKIMRAAGDTRRSSAIYSAAGGMFQQMQMTGEYDRARRMAEALRPARDAPT